MRKFDELAALRHDLERQMTIANTECNRATELQKALDELTVHALGFGALDDDTPLWLKIAELTGRDPNTGNPL